MSDLLDLSAVEARAALDAKSISATELALAYIDAAEQTTALNNYVLLTPEHALDMAARASTALRSSKSDIIQQPLEPQKSRSHPRAHWQAPGQHNHHRSPHHHASAGHDQ